MQRLDRAKIVRVLHINVSDLMIGNRESARRTAVEQLPRRLILHAQKSAAPQHAIDVHRARRLAHAIFTERQHALPARLRLINQPPGDAVDRHNIRDNARIVRAPALQIVIKMRQIDERQCRRRTPLHRLSAARDPFAGLNSRRRSPEMKQRKSSEFCIQFGGQFGRIGIRQRNQAAVAEMRGPRRDRDIVARIHVVPPEQLRTGEARVARPGFLPDFRTFNQRVRLFPEMNLSQFAKVPAIRHDPMFSRHSSRQESALRRTSHRGQNCPQRNRGAVFRQSQKRRASRCMPLHQANGQAHDIEN